MIKNTQFNLYLNNDKKALAILFPLSSSIYSLLHVNNFYLLYQSHY
jgi:hypothetical protein